MDGRDAALRRRSTVDPPTPLIADVSSGQVGQGIITTAAIAGGMRPTGLELATTAACR